jgi:osmotically-inducible protein OsmY
MKTQLAITSLILGAFLWSGVALAEGSDTDRSNIGSSIETFTRDAAITMKVKTKLANEHITSMGRIHVDTDHDGDVWLSGTARTQEAATQAVAIARETEGVQSVHSDIKIQQDD